MKIINSQPSLQWHSLQQQNSLQHHFALHRIYIHYNSKFNLTSKYLGTNAIVVKRVHCSGAMSCVNIFSSFVNSWANKVLPKQKPIVCRAVNSFL